MSVIIRLQNLPWSANAQDIRQFFHGLSIPEGGVHIVGGELGDAFIAFSTDEDARQAFNMNNGRIKEIQIKLLLSSRTEMQKVIETARNQTMAAFMTPAPPPPQPIMPAIVPAAVPELKKEEKSDRRSRRRSRSRSRSRDRKDRSYERKRRRDRSRSKSRDRDRTSRDRNTRERRRRDRSRSRDRTRSRDRDRKNRRSGGNAYQNNQKDQQLPRVIWEPPIQNVVNSPPTNTASLLANFMANNILPNIIQQQQQLQPAQTQQADKIIDLVSPPKGNQNSRWEHNKSFSNNSNDSNSFQEKNRNTDSGYNNQNRREENGVPNCCVKVEPFYGSFSEIRRFFNGLYIQNNGIKIINDEFGKRTGIVYVKFAVIDGKEDAMRRNGDMIRNNPVSVMHITDDEFDQAVDRFMPDDSNAHEDWLKHFGKTVRTCLVMDGVPKHVKENDVRDMLADFNSVDVVIEKRQGSTNSAYMKFGSSLEAAKALKTKLMLEGRVMRVHFCDDDVYEKAKKEFGCDDDGNDSEPDIVTNTILITGLPMKCSERDIIDFFSDIGVMPSKINMISGEAGFSGEAICEFFTNDAAGLSLQKNGMAFGMSTISIKLQPPAVNSNAVSFNPPPHQVNMEMQQNQNFNSNFQNMNPMMHNNHPPPHMNQRLPYPPPQFNNFNNNMFMNRPPFFPPRNFMGPRGPPRFPMGPGNHMGPRGPRGRFNHPHQQQQQQIEDEEEELAPAGCILLMENVPYKAGLDEIMQFLDGYDVPSENILRKYNQNGLPSGETKVIFNSPNEVYQVIEDKKGCKIRERIVYLSQL